MLHGIADHQRELRGAILQVVHHEGREPVVGFELADFGDAAVGFVLREQRRDVLSHGVQQVAILE